MRKPIAVSRSEAIDAENSEGDNANEGIDVMEKPFSKTEQGGSETISAKTDDAQTVTFRPEAVIAILTAADRKTSTVVLQGGMRLTIKGTGEGLRRKVFGTTPEEVQAAIKQQTAGRKLVAVASA